MARGLHQLLPPIEVVDGSWCNANPDTPREWEVRCVFMLIHIKLLTHQLSSLGPTVCDKVGLAVLLQPNNSLQKCCTHCQGAIPIIKPGIKLLRQSCNYHMAYV